MLCSEFVWGIQTNCYLIIRSGASYSFRIGLTCSMRSGVNAIGIEGVLPKIPILLRHNATIPLQKPISRCRSTKLTWIQIFSFLGLVFFPNYTQQKS